MGGPDLTHIACVSSAAFLGSAEFSSGVVPVLVSERSFPLGSESALDLAPEHYHTQLGTADESPTTPINAPTQTSFALSLYQGARAAFSAASDLRKNARLQSLTLSRAHAWLLAVPYKTFT
jgi:hypothetical protein